MSTQIREGMLFGLCNPLLDMTAHVKQDLLKKYNLNENLAILGDDSNVSLYKDMEAGYEIDYCPGGSTQNALRVASWLLQHPNAVTYMGCVGKDKYADIMTEKARSVGLNVVYQQHDKLQTGLCAVLVTGKHRALVAHIYAANAFTVDHFDNDHHWSFVEKALVHYISGFFLTVCPESIMRVAKFSNANNRVFSMNLSAPFISEFYKDRFVQVIPYVNLFFGNNIEAMAFSKHILGVETEDIVSIAKAMSKMESVSDRKRTIIITQGGDPIIVVIGDEVKEYPVPKLDDDKILDTNGAGDAFVGGFFAQYLKGEPIEKCIDCGIWISQIVIQRSGCTFPEKPDYV